MFIENHIWVDHTTVRPGISCWGFEQMDNHINWWYKYDFREVVIFGENNAVVRRLDRSIKKMNDGSHLVELPSNWWFTFGDNNGR